MRPEKRLTAGCDRALTLAFEASGELGHSYVGSEHLLLGLALEGGAAARALRSCGFDEGRIRRLIVEVLGRGTAGVRPTQGFTPRVRNIIEAAAAEAERQGEPMADTRHMLLALLREGDSLAMKLLATGGLDGSRLLRELGEAPKPRRESAPRSPRRPEVRALGNYVTDLTEKADRGELDPLIGRERELGRLREILCRRSKNNPLLLGDPGVGKTALAEGLAQSLLLPDAPECLSEKRILSLDLGSLVAGTKYRGDFEDRLRGLLEEVRSAGNIILFIDEMHMLIGAGAAEGAIDAANILKPLLGRGNVQIIGATTQEEYRRHILKDAALARRFQPIDLPEPTAEEAERILFGLREKYEAHHGLTISPEAIRAAVSLSSRYIPDRFLPDKAIDLMDEAAARVRLSPAPETPPTSFILGPEGLTAERTVTASDVAAVAERWTGIPVEKLTERESRRLESLEGRLKERVMGQDGAVAALAGAIRRGRAGLKDPRRPLGSFLLAGPTGVGKTELCRALAEALFGSEEDLLRLDMSEYSEKFTSSRLIGAPPGYVGSEEGGLLTERIRRRPYSVVLFDELEKAHPEVLDLLLQILEDGRLTDAHGRTADFRSAVVVMTSNAGSAALTEQHAPLGFAPADAAAAREERIRRELRGAFRPEFLNRIDEVLIFRPLGEESLEAIARKLTDEVAVRLEDLGITLSIGEGVLAALAKEGHDPLYGARPLRRCIRRALEDPLTELLLSGALSPGGRGVVTLEDGEIQVRAEAGANAR